MSAKLPVWNREHICEPIQTWKQTNSDHGDKWLAYNYEAWGKLELNQRFLENEILEIEGEGTKKNINEKLKKVVINKKNICI